MDQMEMVEKLRQKANVSYEEARDALEKSAWDLLDALVYLEGQGKIRQEAQGDRFTTRQELPAGTARHRTTVRLHPVLRLRRGNHQQGQQDYHGREAQRA